MGTSFDVCVSKQFMLAFDISLRVILLSVNVFHCHCLNCGIEVWIVRNFCQRCSYLSD